MYSESYFICQGLLLVTSQIRSLNNYLKNMKHSGGNIWTFVTSMFGLKWIQVQMDIVEVCIDTTIHRLMRCLEKPIGGIASAKRFI